jgi:hypothetical protein
MEKISALHKDDADVAEWAYWWLIVDGVLAFKDADDWWNGDNPAWKRSVEFSHLSPTGVLLLNLISAGYIQGATE